MAVLTGSRTMTGQEFLDNPNVQKWGVNHGGRFQVEKNGPYYTGADALKYASENPDQLIKFDSYVSDKKNFGNSDDGTAIIEKPKTSIAKMKTALKATSPDLRAAKSLLALQQLKGMQDVGRQDVSGQAYLADLAESFTQNEARPSAQHSPAFKPTVDPADRLIQMFANQRADKNTDLSELRLREKVNEFGVLADQAQQKIDNSRNRDAANFANLAAQLKINKKRVEALLNADKKIPLRELGNAIQSAWTAWTEAEGDQKELLASSLRVMLDKRQKLYGF